MKILMGLLLVLLLGCGTDVQHDGDVKVQHEGEGESKFLVGLDPEFCEIFDTQYEREECAHQILNECASLAAQREN